MSRAGYGKQGYCKLCSIDDPVLQDQLDKRVGKRKPDSTIDSRTRYVYSPRKIDEWLRSKGLSGASKITVYNHREHVTSPKDRLVSAVAKRASNGYIAKTKVSEAEFLDTLISLSHQRMMDDPGEVTIEQGLKAAQIRSNMRKSGQDLNTLIAIFTQGVPSSGEAVIDDAIEGEAREVQ